MLMSGEVQLRRLKPILPEAISAKEQGVHGRRRSSNNLRWIGAIVMVEMVMVVCVWFEDDRQTQTHTHTSTHHRNWACQVNTTIRRSD